MLSGSPETDLQILHARNKGINKDCGLHCEDQKGDSRKVIASLMSLSQIFCKVSVDTVHDA